MDWQEQGSGDLFGNCLEPAHIRQRYKLPSPTPKSALLRGLSSFKNAIVKFKGRGGFTRALVKWHL